MPTLRVLTAAEQVAEHLKKQLRTGVWSETMPGGAALAKELGVGRMTVDAALDILEEQGDLIGHGSRLPRRISPHIKFSSSLRVAFLPYLIEDYRFDYVMDLQRLLQEDGHTVIFPRTSITLLNENLQKISKLVEKTSADAWIIVAGPRDVLDWFANQKIPAFAWFGRRSGVSLPAIGPDKMPAMIELTRHLISHGHKRITMLTRPIRRLPKPGGIEQAALDEMEQAGIRTGPYNLPAWDGRVNSLAAVIDSTFKHTPPTAMIIDEPPVFFAVQQHLARRGILAPEQVSLACTDWDPYFDFQPVSIAHVRWDSSPWVRRIVRWVGNISQGRADFIQSQTKTTFVNGSSIGPVR